MNTRESTGITINSVSICIFMYADDIVMISTTTSDLDFFIINVVKPTSLICSLERK